MQTRSQKRKELYSNYDHNNVLTKIPKLDNNKNNDCLNDNLSEKSSNCLKSNNSDSSSEEYPESDDESNISDSDSSPRSLNNESIDSEPESVKEYTGESYDNILEVFNENVLSIINGDFFNFISNEYDIKNRYSIKDIECLNNKLFALRQNYIIPNIEIDNILNMNIDNHIKLKLLEKIYIISNSDVLSSNYNNNLKELKELLFLIKSPNLINLDKSLGNELLNNNLLTDSYKYKILTSKMSYNNKLIAYKYMNVIEHSTDNSSDEICKYKTWLNTLLTIPFDNYYNLKITSTSNSAEIQQYLFNIKKILNTNLSFLDYPKDQILNIIAKMIRNPESPINAIGMFGNKGIGKTHFVESIAQALDRPLIKISLGGNTDVNMLKGHNFTYIGSKQGLIVDGLIKSKIMNPIIYCDEIDKISQSHSGSEITGFLIHLIDSTTNHKFNNDEYFSGIEFDLSRALFIFTYNDPNLVDPILSDRLYKIFINNYNQQEKFIITKTHIINNTLKEFNFKPNDIIFSDLVINNIIKISDNSGMRDIKKNIHLIISRLNVLLYSLNIDIITLNYKKLNKKYNTLPIILNDINDIELLLDNNNINNNPNYFSMYM